MAKVLRRDAEQFRSLGLTDAVRTALPDTGGEGAVQGEPARGEGDERLRYALIRKSGLNQDLQNTQHAGCFPELAGNKGGSLRHVLQFFKLLPDMKDCRFVKIRQYIPEQPDPSGEGENGFRPEPQETKAVFGADGKAAVCIKCEQFSAVRFFACLFAVHLFTVSLFGECLF